jgi:hypothetical protein
MYARTNKCYKERGSKTNYVRSSIPHCMSPCISTPRFHFAKENKIVMLISQSKVWQNQIPWQGNFGPTEHTFTIILVHEPCTFYYCLIIIIIISQRYCCFIIIIIIIISCNWVVTRWQWLFYMYTKYEIGY